LKLLAPKPRAEAAWVFSSSYGGGLVEGDRIDLSINVATAATLLMGTQASTKVYACGSDGCCGQTVHATVSDDALLMLAPDPVTCFASASYEQSQKLELGPGGSLLLIDWMTAGRTARGERWAFRGYHSRTEVLVDGRLLLLDALALDASDGPIDAPYRMGRYNCLATVVLVGPRVKALADEVLMHVAGEPVGSREPMIHSASELPGGGALLRVAGVSQELVAKFLRQRVAAIAGQLGDDPWRRRS
jgi:urease accessory protein